MKIRTDGLTLRRAAGLVAWAAAGTPLLLALASSAPGHRAASAGGAAAWAVFGVVFAAVTGAGERRLARDAFCLALETLSALAVTALAGSGFEGILLVVIAAQLVYFFPLLPSLAWTVTQTVLYAFVVARRNSIAHVLVVTFAYLAFQAFTVYTVFIAQRETRQRADLVALHAELKATQHLLAEGSRLAERTKIARDLHDVLGHHLTALSLALEVASHVTEGKGRDEVDRARSIARLLLADVRGVVSQMREEGVDLLGAIRALADGIERPEVLLEAPPALSVADPALAETVLRAAQEIVTNAVRHAGATRLVLSLRREGDTLRLEAKDDGCGVDVVREGNGLRGLQERISDRGGTVSFQSAPRAGFAVLIRIPVGEESS